MPIIAYKTQPKKDTPKVFDGKEDAPKVAKGKKDTPVVPPIKEAEKSIFVFNLENEISKIKISVSFGEILKVDEYRRKIVKILNSQPGATNILNLLEDHPTIYLGPRLEDEQNEEVPPFYVSLSIHDMTFHNVMLDLGASHNIMPKVIMEMMGL